MCLDYAMILKTHPNDTWSMKTLLLLLICLYMFRLCFILASFSYLQWVTADAEIKVPSVENPELLQSCKAYQNRSPYSHVCLTCYQECLPLTFLDSWSIQLHFLPILSPLFPWLMGCYKTQELIDYRSTNLVEGSGDFPLRKVCHIRV